MSASPSPDAPRRTLQAAVAATLTVCLVGVLVVLAAGLASGVGKALSLLAACALVGLIVVLLPTQWRAKAATFGGAFVAAAGVLPILVSGNDGPATTVTHQHTGDLRLVDATLINDAGRAALEIQVHNRGTGRVVISGAVVRVLRMIRLAECTNQGELSLSGRYSVALPTTLSQIEVPLHQQLGPDTADRFSWDFGFPTAALQRGPEVGGADRSYVVLFRAALKSDDRATPLDLGRFVLGAPAVPQRVVQYWPRAYERARVADLAPFFGSDFRWDSHLPCWRTNNASLRAILAQPGARSPDLAAVGADLARVVTPPV